ncbi:MAG: hypothetical protein ACOC93_03890 [Planctomycetota bacterium]
MKARMAVWLCIAALAAPAWAQTTQPPASGRYTGIVTGTDVNVRARPDTDAFVVGQLDEPAQVQVVPEAPDVSGWLQIEPPSGTYVVVPKAAVRVAPSRTYGIVIRDGTRIYPAGPQGRNRGRRPVFGVQLGQGTRVEIQSAQVPGYYTITPLAETYFWIDDNYVVERSEYRQQQRRGAEDGPVRPGDAPEQQAETQPDAGEPETQPDTPATESWDQAEQALQEEFQKPFAERDLQGLLKRYQSIDVSDNAALKPYVEYRIRYLQRMIRSTEQLQEVEQTVAEAQEQYSEEVIERTRRQTALPREQPPSFSARGELTESKLFPGTGASPKRYIIRDPATGRIKAYAQSAGTADLQQHVGQQVGLYGPMRYDRRLDLEIVEARRVVPIAPSGEPVEAQPAPPAQQPDDPREWVPVQELTPEQNDQQSSQDDTATAPVATTQPAE